MAKARAKAPVDSATLDDVLIRIRGAMPSLRPAEKRVASWVLKDPAQVATWSISEVARNSETSETTVSRLVRALGFSGYPAFRLAVSRAATLEEASVEGSGGVPSSDIRPRDTLDEIVHKLAYSDAKAVEETARNIDLHSLSLAVDLLTAARRIDVFGVGASGFVAADLAQKLHRIGKTAFHWSDAHSAVTAAALAQHGDAFVCISHTGETADVVLAQRTAKRMGVRTICVTNFASSALSVEADVALTTAARETTFRSGATSSRIAQLAVIDFVFVALASRNYSASIKALTRTRAEVERLRSLAQI